MKAPVFLLAFILCGFAATASAATLVVTKTADTNDGICDADCSLREAVAVAAADDTVVFSSLFNTPETITLALGSIAITRNLIINGPGQDILTISGNNASRIFRVSGGAVVSLSEMKLTNGLASEALEPVGGAIYSISSSLTLTGMKITNNVARRPGDPPFGTGGGIFVGGGVLTVLNSTISNNTATTTLGGGAVYADRATVNIAGSVLGSNVNGAIRGSGDTMSHAVITVTSASLVNNTGPAIDGGGSGYITVINSNIRNNRGGINAGDSISMLTIDHSIISDNRTSSAVGNAGMATITNTIIKNNLPGGIANGGTMYVRDSSIINNRSLESGGGIRNYGQLFLTNSTVSGNIADDGSGNCNCPGGGIQNGSIFGGAITITNSTIANNRAAGVGGGIYHDNSGTVRIRNSIVANNLSSTNQVDVTGNMVSEGFNLIGNATGSTGWVVTDLLNVNPLLEPLGSNGGGGLTQAIFPGSPAMNGGNNDLARDPFDNSLLIYDQRGNGFLRVVNNTVDIGAYEANYAAGPVTLSGRITTAGGRGIASVRVTLTNGNAVIYAQTNPFGYYRFVDLTPGTTVTVALMHKYYQFDPPQVVVTIDQPRNDLNFVAR